MGKVSLPRCLTVAVGVLTILITDQWHDIASGMTGDEGKTFQDLMKKASRCFNFYNKSSFNLTTKTQLQTVLLTATTGPEVSLEQMSVRSHRNSQIVKLDLSLKFSQFYPPLYVAHKFAWNGNILSEYIEVQNVEEQANISVCIHAVCGNRTHVTPMGDISWPTCEVNDQAIVACTQKSVDGRHQYFATKRCVTNPATGLAQWESAQYNCTIIHELIESNDTVITPNSAELFLNIVTNMTANMSKMEIRDVTLVLNIVDKTLDIPDTMRDVPALEKTVNVLSNLVNGAQMLSEADNADRLLAAARKIARQGQLTDGQLMLSADNMVVAAQQISSDNVQGLYLVIRTDRNDSAFCDGDVTIQPSASPPSGHNSWMFLPRSLMAAGVRATMTVHEDGRVFEAIKPPKEESQYKTKINSHVIAAAVVGGNVSDQDDVIIYNLVHHDQNADNARCVYWDVTSNDWSLQGCSKVVEQSNRRVTTCQCNHLTNFALLMDVYKHGTFLSETHAKPLSLISYIGSGMSLLALIITIFTYSFFKEVAEDTPSLMLLNLCVAVAMSNVVFVFGMWPYATHSDVGCKVVAVLLHFSLLSSFCWMLLEAFNLFLNIVLIFKPPIENFVFKCSLVGWGIPLVVVVVTLGVNKTESYGSSTSGICWLKGTAFYLAFVGPVAAILLVNVATFIMVMFRIYVQTRCETFKSTSSSFVRRLQGGAGVTVLLGLTWTIGFLGVFRDSAVVFSYLFAIFNSLQGLWIFLYFCVLKKNVRVGWSSLLSYRKSQQGKSSVKP